MLNDNFMLGTQTYRWHRVHTVQGVSQTSDTTQKTNIVPLNYGLNELMKIETILMCLVIIHITH